MSDQPGDRSANARMRLQPGDGGIVSGDDARPADDAKEPCRHPLPSAPSASIRAEAGNLGREAAPFARQRQQRWESRTAGEGGNRPQDIADPATGLSRLLSERCSTCILRTDASRSARRGIHPPDAEHLQSLSCLIGQIMAIQSI
jgi:hypothetical protein